MLFSKSFDKLRKHHHGNTLATADGQPLMRFLVLPFCKSSTESVKFGENGSNRFQKSVAFLRQLHAITMTPQEAGSKIFFQKFQLLRYRRLARVQLKGCLRNVEMPGDSFEYFELIKRHDYPPAARLK